MYYIIGSVILWSLFPLATSILAGKINPLFLTFLSASIAVITWFFILVLKESLNYKKLKDIRNVLFNNKLLIIVAGISNMMTFTLWHYAYHNANKIVVTAYYEMWVLFVLLIMVIRKQKNMPRNSLYYVLASFVGVLICTIDPSSNFIKMLVNDPTTSIGLLAAISSAIMTTSHLELVTKFNKLNINNLTKNILPHFLSTFIAVLLLIFYFTFINEKDYFVEENTIEITIIIFSIGFFIVGIGNPLFIKGANEIKNASQLSWWYLTPILAIFWLLAFGLEKFTVYIMIGTTIVLISNFALNSKYSYPLATMGTALFSLIIGYFTLYFKPEDMKKAWMIDSIQNATQMLIIVFALLVVFLLDRLTTSNREADSLLAKISAINDNILSYMNSLSNEKSNLKYSDIFYQSVIKFNFYNKREKQLILIEELYDNELNMFDFFFSKNNINETYLNSLRQDLNITIDEWLTKKTEKTSVAEIVSISVLGFFSILGYMSIRPDNLFGDISNIIFATGISFLIFQVFDMIKPNPPKDFTNIVVSQKFFRKNNLDYFFYDILEIDRLPVPSEDVTFRYYENNQEKRIKLKSESYFIKYLPIIFYFVFMITLSLFLVLKHTN